MEQKVETDSTQILTYHDTLKDWRKKSTQLAFIYDCVSEKYKKRVDIFSLIAFILTSAIALLALGNFGLNDSEYPSLSLGLKITNSILTTMAAVFTGMDRIFGWSNFLNNCHKYQDSLENFMAHIISEQSLPTKYQMDPEQFIIQNKDKFIEILKSAPDISNSDYLNAMELFDKSHKRFRSNLIIV